MTRSTSKNTMSTRGRGQLLAWLDKKLDEDGLPLELLREFLGRPYLVLSPLPPLEIAERVATFRHGPEYVKLMTRIALSTHNPDHALEAEKEYLRVKFYYSRQERRLMLKDVVAAWSSTGDLDKALNWAKEIKDPNLLCHGLWLCYQLHRQAEVRQALRQAIAHHPEPLNRFRQLVYLTLLSRLEEDDEEARTSYVHGSGVLDGDEIKHANLYLCWLDLALGRYDEAIARSQAFDQAIKLRLMIRLMMCTRKTLHWREVVSLLAHGATVASGDVCVLAYGLSTLGSQDDLVRLEEIDKQANAVVLALLSFAAVRLQDSKLANKAAQVRNRITKRGPREDKALGAYCYMLANFGKDTQAKEEAIRISSPEISIDALLTIHQCLTDKRNEIPEITAPHHPWNIVWSEQTRK